MQTYLSVSVRRESGSAVVEVGGELDLASASQLEQALKLALVDAPRVVVVDVGNLYFVDMTGLRVLLDAQLHAARQHGELILTRVRSPTQRVLQLAGVTDRFTIRDNGH